MKQLVYVDNNEILDDVYSVVFNIPNMIKTISKNLGIPRSKLSKLMGISTRQLYKYEKEKVTNSSLASALVLIKYYTKALQHPRKDKNKVIEVIGGNNCEESTQI